MIQSAEWYKRHETSTAMYTNVQTFGGGNIYIKNLSFSKDALNVFKIKTVKTTDFYLNELFYFELSIHKWIMQNNAWQFPQNY